MGQSVDFQYLEAFVGGDSDVVRDVLGLFGEQARVWSAGLSAPDDGWRDLVHTIKGTARGVGARRLGDLAEQAEREGPSMAPEVLAELQAAAAEVEAYLADLDRR